MSDPVSSNHNLHADILHDEEATRIEGILTGSRGSKQTRIRIGGLNNDKVALIAAKEIDTGKPEGFFKRIATRLFWKPMTIQTSEGKSKEILVNINSAVKRLKALGYDKKEIKAALDNNTLPQLLVQQKTKQLISAFARQGMTLTDAQKNELPRVVEAIQNNRGQWRTDQKITYSPQNSLIPYTFFPQTKKAEEKILFLFGEFKLDYDAGEFLPTILETKLKNHPSLPQLNSKDIVRLYHTIAMNKDAKVHEAQAKNEYVKDVFKVGSAGKQINILYEPNGSIFIHFQVNQDTCFDDAFYDVDLNKIVEDPLQKLDISIDQAHKIHELIRAHKREKTSRLDESIIKFEDVTISFFLTQRPQVIKNEITATITDTRDPIL